MPMAKSNGYGLLLLQAVLGSAAKAALFANVWPATASSLIEDYLPENYRMDFIGCSAVNYGKDKDDATWRSFEEIYGKYERQFKKLGLLNSTGVFITEAGMEKRGIDEYEWFENISNTIKEKREIQYCVFLCLMNLYWIIG